LRVVIDALAARFGGTAYMVAQISAALAKREDVEHVWVLVTAGSVADRALKASPAITAVRADLDGSAHLARRAVWQATHLPGLVKAHSIDRMLTVSGMLLGNPRVPIVVHLTNPVAYECGGLANRLRRVLIRHTIERCDTLMVPTEAMGELVAADCRVRPLVLPLGVDREVFSPAPMPGTDVLYVADFYVHKRHDLAIEAWARLPEPRPRLRFVGNPAVDRANFRAVEERAREVDPTGAAIAIDGHLSLGDLVEAYRSAAVLLMPSEHESFAMPLAEALACGVPAVVRGLPSLRETGTGGSVFVDSQEPQAWTQALGGVLGDAQVRHSLRTAALKHAERFSWDALAAAIVAAQSPTLDVGVHEEMVG
jgi:glycosyltransferase involved in cell wall biosynthesis